MRRLLLAVFSLSSLSACAPLEGKPIDGTVLTGFVRSMGSGEAIADARVTLMAADPWDPDDEIEPELPYRALLSPSTAAITNVAIPSRSKVLAATTTGTDGRFEFFGFAPGTFRLVASADGFVPREYGQRVWGAYGRPVTISPGETVGDIEIRMSGTGAIQGRLREAGGEIISAILVQLWRYVYDSDGQRHISVAGTAITDDHGAYRIFWIASGRYYLSAGGPALSEGSSYGQLLLSSKAVFPETFALSVYPGTPELQNAEMVQVLAGSEQTLDWTLPRRETFRIRAVVRDSTTGMVPDGANFRVELQGLGDESMALDEDYIRYDSDRGVLEISDLVAGSYKIGVSGRSPTPSAPDQPAGLYGRIVLKDQQLISATTVVQIADADIEGLALNLIEKVQPIRGRITSVDEARPTTWKDVTVVLYDGANARTKIPVAADGTFEIELNLAPYSDGIGAGSIYRVSVSKLPEGWYVRTVTLNGVDALRNAVPLAEGGAVEIVVSPHGGSIQGVVTDIQGRIAPKAAVVLIPYQMAHRADLFQKTYPDSSGRFDFSGVAPGDYRIHAWEALEPNSYFDPAILERFSATGARILVTESNLETVNVTLIPAEEAQ